MAEGAEITSLPGPEAPSLLQVRTAIAELAGAPLTDTDEIRYSFENKSNFVNRIGASTPPREIVVELFSRATFPHNVRGARPVIAHYISDIQTLYGAVPEDQKTSGTFDHQLAGTRFEQVSNLFGEIVRERFGLIYEDGLEMAYHLGAYAVILAKTDEESAAAHREQATGTD